MPKIVLYGIDISPPVRACLLTLRALELPFEYIEVNLLAGEHRNEDFLKKNPQHTVPLLDDNGTYIWDSHAICCYLVDKYGKTDELYPKDLVKRAHIDQRLYFDASVFFMSLRNITVPYFYKKVNQVPQEKIDNVRDGYVHLENFLADNLYVTGNTFNIADFCLGATASSLPAVLKMDPKQFPKIAAWLGRLEKLPYYKEANKDGAENMRVAFGNLKELLLPLLLLLLLSCLRIVATLNDALAAQLADAEAQADGDLNSDSNAPHIRKKRLVWITDDGRLALPPGTTLTFTPTIAMPLVRHPPEGFFSNLTISFPVTIDFDKLGLTDNQNPLGDLPFFARSFGHGAGQMVGEYVSRYLHVQRRKRDLSEQRSSVEEQQPFKVHEELLDYPELPAGLKHIFHGGERVLLYGVVEDFLATFGMDGKACLLRTICEMHSRSLEKFGVFGELTKLFLTVTKSPFSELIPEYVRAQRVGEGKQAPGECFPYYKACPKSIFKALANKYKQQATTTTTTTTTRPVGEYQEQQAVLLPSSKDQEQEQEQEQEQLNMNALYM
ncbi:hypothetical protein ACLKA6_015846 [Drosophila palustris]